MMMIGGNDGDGGDDVDSEEEDGDIVYCVWSAKAWAAHPIKLEPKLLL